MLYIHYILDELLINVLHDQIYYYFPKFFYVDYIKNEFEHYLYSQLIAIKQLNLIVLKENFSTVPFFMLKNGMEINLSNFFLN